MSAKIGIPSIFLTPYTKGILCAFNPKSNLTFSSISSTTSISSILYFRFLNTPFLYSWSLYSFRVSILWYSANAWTEVSACKNPKSVACKGLRACRGFGSSAAFNPLWEESEVILPLTSLKSPQWLVRFQVTVLPVGFSFNVQPLIIPLKVRIPLILSLSPAPYKSPVSGLINTL